MKYKYLLPTILWAVFGCMLQVSAQETKPREIGLQFSNVNFGGNNNFSAFLKKQKSENVYRRIRFFFGSISVQAIEDDYALSLGGGLAIGRENRKALDDKLVFYQGPEVSLGMTLSTNSDENSVLLLNGGFGWVLGLQHSFNDRWAMNIETIPGIRGELATGEIRPTGIGVSLGFNNMVSVGLVRKF